MIISRCKKDEFNVVAVINRDMGVYDICWGKEDVFENIGYTDEETGEWVDTGEVRDTDYCTFEMERVYSRNISTWLLDSIFLKAQRVPKMAEIREMGRLLGFDDAEVLEWMKKNLLNTISRYDKSENVEDFTIGGVHLWLDSSMRNKVRENLESCEWEGLTETVLRIDGFSLPTTITQGWQMYYAVLKYARETWNVTEIHKAAVPKLGTMDDVEVYEATFADAYPPKLSF